MLAVFDESFMEAAIRWHVYRRWKRYPSRRRKAEYEFHLLMRSLPKGSLFLDCGANVGDVTAVARKYGMRVIAFEPDEEALAVLQRRFEDDRQVTIIPKAVGGNNRVTEFYQRPEVASGKINYTQASSLFRTQPEGLKARRVEVIDIVEFIKNLDAPISVLKMDIEGAEAECLERMLDAKIIDIPGKILVETHESLSAELSERLDRIRCRIHIEGYSHIDLDWM